jgi:ACR3 family arsenite transporter
VIGVGFGKAFPGVVDSLSKMEISHVNLPIAVLIWLMIYPMMLKFDFSAILKVGDRPKGLFITLFVNWLVKPFSMTQH